MRILHVTPAFSPSIGGIEAVVEQLALHQTRAGHSAGVAHVSPSNRRFSKEVHLGYPVWRVPLLGHRLMGWAAGLAKVCRQFDLIHVHDPQLAAIAANALVQCRGKPLLLSTHGGYWHTKKHRLFKLVHSDLGMRFLLGRFALVLCSSTSDYRRFSAVTDKARLVENGVDILKFSEIAEPGSLLRWLYWGRLAANKRLDVLLEYVAQVRAEGHDLRLTICGNDFDGTASRLTRCIADLGLSDCVSVRHGMKDEEIASLIQQAPVFVSASEYEGFGISVVEAMSAGMVIVARDMEPLNGFVKAGRNGVLLKFDHSAGDFTKIRNLLSLPESEAAAISRNNVIDAGRFGWHSVSKQFEHHYRVAEGAG